MLWTLWELSHDGSKFGRGLLVPSIKRHTLDDVTTNHHISIESLEDPTCSTCRTLPECVKLYPSNSGFRLAPIFWKHKKSPSPPLLRLDSVEGLMDQIWSDL